MYLHVVCVDFNNSRISIHGCFRVLLAMYRYLQCLWNSQVRTFSNNLRYKCTSTKTMYDVGTHSSLATLAIIALSLLKKKKKKERWWTISRGRRKCFFWYLALHKRISAVSKASTNADTTVENAYTVKSAWKCETAKKNQHFRWNCLWAAILHH